MKLGSDQTECGYRAFHFVDRAVAFPRIDAREANKLARKLLDHIGYFIVGEWRKSGRGFGVPREQHGDDIEFFVHSSDFIHLANRNLAAKERLGGFPERLDRSVEKARGRQVHVHVDGFGHWFHLHSMLLKRPIVSETSSRQQSLPVAFSSQARVSWPAAVHCAEVLLDRVVERMLKA